MNLQTEIHSTTLAKCSSTTTDIAEIKNVLSGDVNAFERIMRRYNQRLYRIARSILHDEHEAMDVVQEAYIKAYYELKQFKGPEGFEYRKNKRPIRPSPAALSTALTAND